VAKKPAKVKTKAKAKPKATAKSPEQLQADFDKAIDKIDRAGAEAAIAAGATVDPIDGEKSLLAYVVYAETKLSAKDIARAKLLLELGADPAYMPTAEENPWSILQELSLSPNQDAALEILEAMLAKCPKLRATTDAGATTPLELAMWYGGHPAYWEKLVALGDSVASRGPADGPIFHAISHGNRKGIEWLVKRGVSLAGTIAYAKDPENQVDDRTLKLLEKLGAT
jgi:hypothetical protein